jgi:hypothetical protein
MQFLVLARVAEGVAMEQVLPHVKAEAKMVWQQYSAETVRSVYYIADMSGAVLMCEAPTLEAMQEIVTQFPMAQAGVLKFEIIPLRPYIGLGSLFAKS